MNKETLARIAALEGKCEYLNQEIEFLRSCLDSAPVSLGETFGFDQALRLMKDGQVVQLGSERYKLTTIPSGQHFSVLKEEDGSWHPSLGFTAVELLDENWRLVNLPARPRTSGKKPQAPRKKGNPWKRKRRQ